MHACLRALACKDNVDDIGHFRALLSDLHTVVNVDDRRIYATGYRTVPPCPIVSPASSPARSQRLRRTLAAPSSRPVADCQPERPVPVLEIHGTTDPGWPYKGGDIRPGLWSHIGAAPGE